MVRSGFYSIEEIIKFGWRNGLVIDIDETALRKLLSDRKQERKRIQRARRREENEALRFTK
jgi:hypothetical protein